MLAATGLLFVFLRMTSGLGLVALRRALRVSMAVLLFMPWYSYADQDYLAPAFLIAAFEALVRGSELWTRAGIPLLASMLSAIIASALISIAFRRR